MCLVSSQLVLICLALETQVQESKGKTKTKTVNLETVSRRDIVSRLLIPAYSYIIYIYPIRKPKFRALARRAELIRSGCSKPRCYFRFLTLKKNKLTNFTL